jgi:hypothetical protein
LTLVQLRTRAFIRERRPLLTTRGVGWRSAPEKMIFTTVLFSTTRRDMQGPLIGPHYAQVVCRTTGKFGASRFSDGCKSASPGISVLKGRRETFGNLAERIRGTESMSNAAVLGEEPGRSLGAESPSDLFTWRERRQVAITSADTLSIKKVGIMYQWPPGVSQIYDDSVDFRRGRWAGHLAAVQSHLAQRGDGRVAHRLDRRRADRHL